MLTRPNEVRRAHGFVVAMLVAIGATGCARTSLPAVPAASLPKVSEQAFAKEVLQQPVPTVVMMEAAWCPQCTEAKPQLLRWQERYAGQVHFRAVDVDANPFLKQKYDISQYPTLLLFAGGEERVRLVGSAELATLPSELDAFLQEMKPPSHKADSSFSPSGNAQ